MAEKYQLVALSVVRPSCVRRHVFCDGVAWMFTLSLVVVAGPTQPPPSRIGPVSPLIHSVSNPPDVDEGVGSIGRWGWAGTKFRRRVAFVESSPRRGFCVAFPLDTIVSLVFRSRPRIPAGPSLPYWAVGCGTAICGAVWGASRAGGGYLILGRGRVGSC